MLPTKGLEKKRIKKLVKLKYDKNEIKWVKVKGRKSTRKKRNQNKFNKKAAVPVKTCIYTKDYLHQTVLTRNDRTERKEERKRETCVW